jgi:hypothetical protein
MRGDVEEKGGLTNATIMAGRMLWPVAASETANMHLLASDSAMKEYAWQIWG